MKLPAAALAVLLFAVGPASGQAIQPDARLQTEIARAGRARNEKELEKQLRVLADLGGRDFAALVPQLVYFTMQQTDAHEAMLPAVIADRLHISDVQMAAGLVPYLDAPDDKLRAQLDNLLGGIDDKQPDGPRDFTAYAEILRRAPAKPPFGLVRYMYRVDADAALGVFAEIETAPEKRAEILAARDKVAGLRAHRAAGAIVAADELDSARAALAGLARRPEWWARLYAVAELGALPELRAPQLLKALGEDPHQLVRDGAKALARGAG